MVDHAAAALKALQAAHEVDANEESALGSDDFYLREAHVHAGLEQAKWLREIADQFDTIPRRANREKNYAALFPLHDAADMLEGLAIGDEPPAREMTIARLVLHHVMPYPHAERIAGDSRLFAHESGDPWRLDEVNAAITLLKIEVPTLDAEVVEE